MLRPSFTSGLPPTTRIWLIVFTPSSQKTLNYTGKLTEVCLIWTKQGWCEDILKKTVSGFSKEAVYSQTYLTDITNPQTYWEVTLCSKARIVVHGRWEWSALLKTEGSGKGVSRESSLFAHFSQIWSSTLEKKTGKICSQTHFLDNSQWHFIKTIPLNQTATNELAELGAGSNLNTKSSQIIAGLKTWHPRASSAGWLPLRSWIPRLHLKAIFTLMHTFRAHSGCFLGSWMLL